VNSDDDILELQEIIFRPIIYDFEPKDISGDNLLFARDGRMCIFAAIFPFDQQFGVRRCYCLTNNLIKFWFFLL
jgi:hypothetical protein